MALLSLSVCLPIIVLSIIFSLIITALIASVNDRESANFAVFMFISLIIMTASMANKAQSIEITDLKKALNTQEWKMLEIQNAAINAGLGVWELKVVSTEKVFKIISTTTAEVQ